MQVFIAELFEHFQVSLPSEELAIIRAPGAGDVSYAKPIAASARAPGFLPHILPAPFNRVQQHAGTKNRDGAHRAASLTLAA